MNDQQMLYAALVLIGMLGYVMYTSYLLYKSTPTERKQRQDEVIVSVEKVIDEAEKLSRETKGTELDDDAVKALKHVWKLYKDGYFEKSQNIAPQEPLYDPAEHRD